MSGTSEEEVAAAIARANEAAIAVKREMTRQTHIRKVTNAVILLTAVVSTVGAMSAAFVADTAGDGHISFSLKTRAERQMEAQGRTIEALRAQVTKLAGAQPSVLPPEPTTALANDITKRLSALEATQAQINTTITASPEKALSIPMLRRDIDDLKASNVASQEQLRRDIDRIYDLNKWIIGGLGAGVLSLTISQILRRKPSATDLQPDG